MLPTLGSCCVDRQCFYIITMWDAAVAVTYPGRFIEAYRYSEEEKRGRRSKHPKVVCVVLSSN